MARERPISLIDKAYEVDKAFYDSIVRRTNSVNVQEALVLPFTGRGFRVAKGHAIRFVLVDGPQVGDVGLWAADDPNETISATRTQLLEGWFLRPYSRVWSDVPRLRPLATCIADTVAEKYPDPQFHHHWVGTHCAPEWLELRGAGPSRNACHINLLQAIEPFGMKEAHIRDNINIHQKSRISAEDGKTYNARSDGGPGDFVELYAEIDLIVGLSICPNADNTRYWSEPEEGVVKPLKVEIYDTGIAPVEFQTWHDWRPAWRGEWKRLVDRQL